MQVEAESTTAERAPSAKLNLPVGSAAGLPASWTQQMQRWLRQPVPCLHSDAPPRTRACVPTEEPSALLRSAALHTHRAERAGRRARRRSSGVRER